MKCLDDSKLFLFGLYVAALVGCGATDAVMTARGETQTPPAELTPATGCEPGSQSCYCPDGALSGTQYCDAQQRLSECACASSSGSAGGAAPLPTGGQVGQVCDELAGIAGCDARSYQSAQVPASILFVVDRSGSMACNAPPVQSVEDCNQNPKRIDGAAPSRWETTVGALEEAFAGMAGNEAAVGLNFFSTDGVCGADSTAQVGVAPIDPSQITLLSDALAVTVPAGGTPIVGATILAYNHLHEELHAAGNRFVVLITDGEESCGAGGDAEDTADLLAARRRLLDEEVGKAREANIRTFVIGAPGSEGARGFLSELAFRGGTARNPGCVHGDAEGTTGDCHFDLTTESDFGQVLRQALGDISGQALACEFATPPGGGSMLNVQATVPGGSPECFAFDPAPCEAGANGWQFVKDAAGNNDVTRVQLCGAACDMVKRDPSTVVDVILGCAVLE